MSGSHPLPDAGGPAITALITGFTAQKSRFISTSCVESAGPRTLPFHVEGKTVGGSSPSSSSCEPARTHAQLGESKGAKGE